MKKVNKLILLSFLSLSFLAGCGTSYKDVSFLTSINKTGETQGNIIEADGLLFLKTPEYGEKTVKFYGLTLGSESGMSTISIPSNVNGYEVMSVEGDAGLEGVETIIVPETVRFIDTLNVSTLRTVEFQGNSKLEEIGDYCFSNSGLTSFSLPKSVKEIGDSAFEGLSSLTTFTVPSDSALTSIGEKAFYECSKLTSINFPSSLISVDNSAFSFCTNLKSVSTKDATNLSFIGPYCFSFCSSLTSFDIPSSLKNLLTGTFGSCTSLSSVNNLLESNVEGIYGSVFSYCSALTEIKLPRTLKHFSSSAFYESGLYKVFIPKEATFIKSIYELSDINQTYPFYYYLENSYYPNFADTSYPSVYYIVNCFGGLTGEYNGFEYYIKSYGNDEIGAVISGYTGEETSINIPSSIVINGNEVIVREIGDKALYENNSLEHVTLPSTLWRIGDSAFSYGLALRSVTLPNDNELVEIDDYAFFRCSNLTSFELGANSKLSSIGERAFDQIKLNKFFVPKSVNRLMGYGLYDEMENIFVESEVVPSTWATLWAGQEPFGNIHFGATYEDFLLA